MTFTIMMKNDNTNYIKACFVTEIYVNEETNYRVSVVKTKKNERVKIVGNYDKLYPDYYYDIYGEYKTNNYGVNFNVKNIAVSKDNNKSSLIAYFSSPLFKGIGKSTASKIVDFLGSEALSKIEENVNIINDIPGLKDKQKYILINNFKENIYTNKIYSFLMDLDISYTMANKIFKNYLFETINVINENCYDLIKDIEGFGFLKADNIFLRLGNDSRDIRRINAAILHSLSEYCFNSGNTYILIDELILEVFKLLKLKDITDIIKEEINNLIRSNRLVIVEDKIFLKYIFDAENNISNIIKMLVKYDKYLISNNNFKFHLKNMETKNHIKYTEGQRKVLENIFLSHVSVVTGGPGTGKSTIVKGIIDLFIENGYYENQILLCAPTGKASKRLNQVTKLESFTIHKALGYSEEGFSFNENNQLPYKLIIVDEASMIDVFLASSLLKAVSLNSVIVFIGDVNQIPSVGPGNFLNDLIDSKLVNTFRLNETMRQVSDSNIIRLANMVLNNEVDFNKLSDKKDVFLYNINENNYFDFLEKLLNNYLDSNKDFDDLTILIPMYASNVGIDKTNLFVQEHFNIKIKGKFLKGINNNFYVSDKVLQLTNNPDLDIVNGDSGNITNIIDDELYIDFNIGKIIKYPKALFDDLTLAYSISIHKSQGSEIKNVIIPIFRNYRIMLRKKLYYTAITRAKEKLILIGDLNLLENNNLLKDEVRFTYLKVLLKT